MSTTTTGFTDYFQSKWVKAIAAGSVAFIGYAIYFDRKRRLDPMYKQKIRQNRKMKQLRANKETAKVDFPDPRDMHANEQFFFQQISLGEERLQSGNVNEGIMHLSNAVVSCQQPAELLTIFRQTIPPDHFELLVHAIPGAKLRQQASLRNLMPRMEEVNNSPGGSVDGDEEKDGNKKIFMLDDELE